VILSIKMMGFGINGLAFGDWAWSFGHILILRRVAGTAKPSMTNGVKASAMRNALNRSRRVGGGRKAGLDVRGDHLGSRPSPRAAAGTLGGLSEWRFLRGQFRKPPSEILALAIPNSRMALSSRSLDTRTLNVMVSCGWPKSTRNVTSRFPRSHGSTLIDVILTFTASARNLSERGNMTTGALRGDVGRITVLSLGDLKTLSDLPSSVVTLNPDG
jgi:hypothetical protein